LLRQHGSSRCLEQGLLRKQGSSLCSEQGSQGEQVSFVAYA
jgi:hypothetical protein